MTLKEIKDILNAPIPMPALFSRRVLPPSHGKRSFERFAEAIGILPRRRRPLAVVKPNRLFAIEGMLRRAHGGAFIIDGTSFVVNEDTFVVGELKSNARAKVKGLYLADGKRIATAVVVRECA